MTYKEDYWDEYARHDTSNEGAILSGCLQGVLGIILVVLIVLLCCMLSACRTQKEAVTDTRHTADTVYAMKTFRDSIWLHDSIYVSQQQRGDTILLTTDRWHTQYRDRWRTDTIYRSRTDTVVKTIVKQQQGKPAGTLTWWQQTRLYVANVLMGGMLIAIAVWLIRRRMRV